MARYIDADALKDNFCDACATLKRYKRTVEGCRNTIDSYGNECFKMRLIDTTPTADVIPKEFLTRKEDEAYERGYAEANSEVEEIFEKIETLLSLNSLQGDVFVGKYFDVDLENDIAELKKKYTESCTKCTHFVGCECFDGKTCDEYTEKKE